MATISNLPDELIVIILENKNISIEDVMNLSYTCTRFQNCILNNKFWEKKFYQRYTYSANIIYNIERHKSHSYLVDYKVLIQKGTKYIKKLYYYVSLLSDNNLRAAEEKELELLLCSISNDPVIYFITDELNRYIFEPSLWQFGDNLTNRYRFETIFRCVKQYRLKYEHTRFVKLPEEKQTLELLFTIAAQYFQPHVSYSIVKKWLDNIAEEILHRLKIKYPAHSIFSISSEQLSIWRNNNINDTFWNQEEAEQIMCVLEEYIFSELEVHELQLLLTFDLEDKYIKDYDFKYFRIYLLTATCHCVARRLGIRCDLSPYQPLNHYSYVKDIQITWKPRYDAENLNNEEHFLMLKNDSHLPYPFNMIRGRTNRLDISYRTLSYDYNQITQIISHIIQNIKSSENNRGCMCDKKILMQVIQGNQVDITRLMQMHAHV